ncbi:SLBB domain-containing protein [bacterium]|nr:SLBB domain-containing protein [bacterium]MBU1632975.1 SLBB domain-containing protein [bacterium]MBU1873097.1 SLBB domain-containing protein [bacterium]
MKRFYILLLVLLGMGMGFAQESVRTQTPTTGRFSDRPSASRYILSTSSDALLMTVKVWGEVQKPGLYDIPIGTDLIELISSAGGPKETAQLSKIKIIHGSKPDQQGYVSKVNIKEFLETGDDTLIPEMKPNDTIIVPMKPSQYVRVSMSWTQQLMSLVSAYALAEFYFNR